MTVHRYERCDYKTPWVLSNLKRHMGVVWHECKQKSSQGKHRVCRKCYKKATGKNSRVEKVWCEYVDEHLGNEFAAPNDRSL